MGKEYKVLSDKLFGHKKGDTIQGPVHPALIGVHVKSVSQDEALKCPECQQHGTQRDKKQTFKSYDDLAKHYAGEHGAYAPPREEE